MRRHRRVVSTILAATMLSGLAATACRAGDTAAGLDPESTVGETGATTLRPPVTRFTSSISPLDAAVTERMVDSSWTEGCPVALDDLRYLRVTYRTEEGESEVGELVVAADLADEVVTAFAALYDANFPIASMRLVDDFGADDLRSMQANNTSAFNCRFVAGTTSWSWHAYGRAIDINPLVNPYLSNRGVDPPEGEAFLDRTQTVPGMIRDGDAVTSAFADLGWEWGGSWSSAPDYQHFARTDG